MAKQYSGAGTINWDFSSGSNETSAEIREPERTSNSETALEVLALPGPLFETPVPTNPLVDSASVLLPSTLPPVELRRRVVDRDRYRLVWPTPTSEPTVPLNRSDFSAQPPTETRLERRYSAPAQSVTSVEARERVLNTLDRLEFLKIVLADKSEQKRLFLSKPKEFQDRFFDQLPESIKSALMGDLANPNPNGPEGVSDSPAGRGRGRYRNPREPSDASPRVTRGRAREDRRESTAIPGITVLPRQEIQISPVRTAPLPPVRSESLPTLVPTAPPAIQSQRPKTPAQDLAARAAGFFRGSARILTQMVNRQPIQPVPVELLGVQSIASPLPLEDSSRAVPKLVAVSAAQGGRGDSNVPAATTSGSERLQSPAVTSPVVSVPVSQSPVRTPRVVAIPPITPVVPAIPPVERQMPITETPRASSVPTPRRRPLIDLIQSGPNPQTNIPQSLDADPHAAGNVRVRVQSGRVRGASRNIQWIRFSDGATYRAEGPILAELQQIAESNQQIEAAQVRNLLRTVGGTLQYYKMTNENDFIVDDWPAIRNNQSRSYRGPEPSLVSDNEVQIPDISQGTRDLITAALPLQEQPQRRRAEDTSVQPASAAEPGAVASLPNLESVVLVPRPVPAIVNFQSPRTPVTSVSSPPAVPQGLVLASPQNRLQGGANMPSVPVGEQTPSVRVGGGENSLQNQSVETPPNEDSRVLNEITRINTEINAQQFTTPIPERLLTVNLWLLLSLQGPAASRLAGRLRRFLKDLFSGKRLLT